MVARIACVLTRANHILEVLQETGVVLGRALRLHRGNLLDLALKDKEAVVLKVDALRGQQLLDLGTGLGLAVNKVLRAVVTVSHARHDKLGALDILGRLALLLSNHSAEGVRRGARGRGRACGGGCSGFAPRRERP